MTTPAPADEWGALAGDWDALAAAYADAALAHLLSLSPSPLVPGSPARSFRVLDFGCGTGLLSERLLPHLPTAARVVALDVSPGMIAALEAKALGGVEARCGDVGDMMEADDPLLREGFDLVLASSVLAFVPSHPAAVASLAALLRPGGWLLHWDWDASDGGGDGGISPQAAAAALGAAGLEAVEVGAAPFEQHGRTPLFGRGRRGVP
mmetsp:Transcript_10241/g.34861  ORF Transcript_10241/g.34861 Transcript_10241/m.34861 type:complete len:208 (-) Transcript_10241:37-660(-)